MANEEQLEWLKQGVRGWNVWREKNLKQIDLSAANLREANLFRADLSEADLSATDLSATDLCEANLRGADLRGVHLSEANLSGADLREANLSGAHLREAHLRGANLRGADLRGADLFRVDLSGADLSGAHLRGADLSGAHLSGADLRETDLFRVDLSGADLSGADLRGVDLSGADLSGTDLSEANLFRANLSVADLREANLSGADLREANLREANLRGTNFSVADLRGANLSGAHLIGAHLIGAHLSAADLRETDLSGADLSSTVFAKNDLTFVIGLDTIRHHGPSWIDFRTMIFPTPGPILTTFLRGTGFSEYLIEAVNGRSLPLQPVSVKVFISFASSDQDLCRNLREHLSLLVRLRMIVLSYEAVLAPDIHQWEKKTSVAFQEAQVILLLVSAPFLASHQAWKDVIEPALGRHQQGNIRLIPLILRPIAWKGSPLADIQALPMNGRPVTEWEQIDTPLMEISEDLRKVVQPLYEMLTEQAKLQRSRDLIMAELILTNTQAAEKHGIIQEQKKAVEVAEKTYQAVQAQLQEAQQHYQDMKEIQEILLTELAVFERTSVTLDEKIRTLDTRLQSNQEIFKGMINGSGG